MDYSNFVILLARQRSGTNVLRSVLKHHPDIFCVPEVFNNRLSPNYKLEVEASYFNFLEKYTKGDIKRIIMSEDHEVFFLDFLDYLRCFTEKKCLLIDVKYMSVHHVNKHWHFITEEPFLFQFIKEHGLRVLNLTRINFLRYYLSEMKTRESRTWYTFDESVVGKKDWYVAADSSVLKGPEARLTVNVEHLLETLALCQSENEMVENSFSSYKHYLTFDYDEMFHYTGAPMSSSILERIALWLGVEHNFPETRPEYKKQSHLTLKETIGNYEAVATALQGTRFEYCLQDEEIYLQP